MKGHPRDDVPKGRAMKVVEEEVHSVEIGTSKEAVIGALGEPDEEVAADRVFGEPSTEEGDWKYFWVYKDPYRPSRLYAFGFGLAADPEGVSARLVLSDNEDGTFRLRAYQV